VHHHAVPDEVQAVLEEKPVETYEMTRTLCTNQRIFF
jgi:hypothetical protein